MKFATAILVLRRWPNRWIIYPGPCPGNWTRDFRCPKLVTALEKVPCIFHPRLKTEIWAFSRRVFQDFDNVERYTLASVDCWQPAINLYNKFRSIWYETKSLWSENAIGVRSEAPIHSTGSAKNPGKTDPKENRTHSALTAFLSSVYILDLLRRILVSPNWQCED